MYALIFVDSCSDDIIAVAETQKELSDVALEFISHMPPNVIMDVANAILDDDVYVDFTKQRSDGVVERIQLRTVKIPATPKDAAIAIFGDENIID